MLATRWQKQSRKRKTAMQQAKALKRRVTLGRNEFQKMAKTLEAATDNKYVSAGSNRVRGDEAKALGDYKEAIEHFTKWRMRC